MLTVMGEVYTMFIGDILYNTITKKNYNYLNKSFIVIYHFSSLLTLYQTTMLPHWKKLND